MKLHPILIVRGGRSGSTLLMQLLGTSPRVAFDRVPPFEKRYLAYLVKWSQLLRPVAPTPEWNQPAILQSKGPMEVVGGIPIGRAELLHPERGDLWPAALAEVWEAFSARATAS